MAFKIHYYVRGHGPVCLFPSPGWGFSVDYAVPIPVLERFFTVVYYDTRLSGKSTGPADRTKYGGNDFVQDMDALREFFHLSRVWIAGHSGGGLQVLLYGIYHSDHCQGIISIDPQTIPDSFWAHRLDSLTNARKGQPYFTQAKADMFDGRDTTPTPLLTQLSNTAEFYFHDYHKATRFPKHWTVSDTVWAYCAASHFLNEDLSDRVHWITAPLLLIAGDDDIVCNPISQVMRIVPSIPGASMAIINNCGHIPWLDQPEIFNAVCSAWIAETLNRRGLL